MHKKQTFLQVDRFLNMHKKQSFCMHKKQTFLQLDCFLNMKKVQTFSIFRNHPMNKKCFHTAIKAKSKDI